MNHYERLNVTPDASVEVIRAAYRALATKLHPDRQGGNSGPNEAAHEAMAALNASYLVLTNAKARAEYDAQFKASHRFGKDKASASDASKRASFSDEAFEQTPHDSGHVGGQHRTGGGDTHATGFSWMNAQAGVMGDRGKREDASSLPRWAWALLFSSVLTAGLMIWVMMQKSEIQGFDKSLSEASQNGQVTAPSFTSPASIRPKPPVISEDELAKLSNDELLARMPALIGESVLPEPQDASDPLAAKGSSPLGEGNALRLKQSMELGSLTATGEQP